MFDCSQFPQIVQAWDRLNEFWGYPDNHTNGESETMLYDLRGLPLPLYAQEYQILFPRIWIADGKRFLIHSGAVWEVCKYLGVPYPKNAVNEIIDTRVADHYGGSSALRSEVSPSYMRFMASDREKICKLYQSLTDEIIPYVMKADMEKKELARLRAIWGVLIVELRLARARLASIRRQPLDE